MIYKLEFNKLKKKKFSSFEIYLGDNNKISYFYSNGKKVANEDVKKFELIDQNRFDLIKLLEYSRFDNLDKVISSVKNSKELLDYFEQLLKHFLAVNCKGKYDIGNLNLVCLIDGVETEIIDSNNKNKEKLYNFIYYFIWFYIILVIILSIIDFNLGGIALSIPIIISIIWAYYGLFKELRNGDNKFIFYLFKLPKYLFFLLIVFAWFIFPLFLFSEINYKKFFLEILGGLIGEIVWSGVYLVIMFYLGSWILEYIESIIKKIKSKF